MKKKRGNKTMSLIETGLEKGLIKFDADRNFITYMQPK